MIAIAFAWSRFAASAVLVLGFVQPTLAFQISGKGIPGFGAECVHERITTAAMTCIGAEACPPIQSCNEIGWHDLRTGVRWNDDPLRLLAHGRTYSLSGAYFFHGNRISKRNSESVGIAYNTMYRSHFGDLQFLHAIARREAETARETVRQMLLWGEFAYKVSTGVIPGSTSLADVPIQGIPQLFSGKAWSVEFLFAMRCTSTRDCKFFESDKPRVPNFALGSLLHLVQDSYADGHTLRQFELKADTEGAQVCFGPIERFHVYSLQDPRKHRKADETPAWLSGTVGMRCENPVSVSSRILQYAGTNGAPPATWSEVRAYLEAGPLRLSHPDAGANSGPFARD